jgi:hypothetical protein
MNSIYKYRICIIATAMLICCHIIPVVLVTGNSSTPYSVSTGVSTTAYDDATGTFFVGLEAGGDTYAVSKALRPALNATPTLVPIASNGLLTGQGIEFLTLATATGSEAANLALVTLNNDPFLQTQLIASTTDGATVTQSSVLKDASGVINTDGQDTAGIVGIAAQTDFIFAAVRPTDDANSFGDANSGIAVVQITPTTLTLNQKAAVSGDAGIKAQLFDPTVAEIQIQADPTITPNQIVMHWDDILQRLYMGIGVSTGANNGDGAKAVVVGRVSSQGVLSFSSIAPDAAFTAGKTTNMVGAINDADILELNSIKLGIMHTSTGPDYLIMNGGNIEADIDEGNNHIYALPLVNDPTNPAAQGTIAKKDAPLVDFKFVTPATVNADLPESTEAPVMVGGGTLPIPHTVPITALMVSGDTVYISLGGNQTDLAATGLFYSQALFDETGKIIRWTPWTKAAFPAHVFTATASASALSFFAVDAANGRVWGIDDQEKRSIALTQWNQTVSNSASLLDTLNSTLSQGCYSLLDLDQSTRGFAGNTTSRYALFGGANKVIFTQVSTATAATPTSAQTVTTDYTLPANFLETQLPPHAGAVTVLEYSRQLIDNFFFAGTNTGLFAFSADGNGLDVATFSDLNLAPFSTSSWQKIAAVSGSIIDLKTTGNALYLLAYHQSTQRYTLSRVLYDTTLASTFATQRVIAQTGTGIFNTVSIFTSIGIVATQEDGSAEQVVLGTNHGIFQSTRIGGVQDATDQDDALWTLVDNNTQWFTAIGYIDNASIPAYSPSVLWPLSRIDAYNCKLFNNGTVYQLAGSQDAEPFAFVPADFASNESPPPFLLKPLFYLWSDGNRRFFITSSLTIPGRTALASIPYNTSGWNITSLPEQYITYFPLSRIHSYNWASPIGVTGIFAVGTNKGVLTLE